MDAWVIWVVAACALGVGELLTSGFFLAPFAVGGAFAAIVALAGAGAVPQWIFFIVVSLLALLVVRPVARAHLKMAPQIRTGTAALIGRRAIVLERISNDEAIGCIRVDGEVWTARAYDDEQVIEAGTPVQIVDIRGATALVTD